MNIYFAIVGMFVFAFAGGYCACELIHRLRKPEAEPKSLEDIEREALDSGVLAGIERESTPFAVTGKPKKPPFRERKKELKAGARTKRQKLEEWRD